MTSSTTSKLPATGILYGLKVGQVHSFPIEKLSSIRSIASQCSLRWGRKYITSADRETRTIKVMRTA